MTQPTPDERLRRQYEDAEKKAAETMERLVGSEAFSEQLAMFAGNVTALAQVANVGLDRLVRATRLAGRADIARLGRQIARTEDKLESVLVVVEGLEAELALARRERDEARARLAETGADPAAPATPTSAAPAAPATSATSRPPRSPRTVRTASAEVLGGARSTPPRRGPRGAGADGSAADAPQDTAPDATRSAAPEER